jgi:molybdopterin-synthase adenylyltransferase
VAAIQVAEALKILSGHPEKISRQITRMDLWDNHRDLIALPVRDPECPCCGKGTYPYLDGAMGADAMFLCGRNSVQIRRKDGGKIDLDQLNRTLSPVAAVEKNKFLLRATVDGYQLTVFADGRAIIGGTNDLGVAKSLYARYIGA